MCPTDHEKAKGEQTARLAEKIKERDLARRAQSRDLVNAVWENKKKQIARELIKLKERLDSGAISEGRYNDLKSFYERSLGRMQTLAEKRLSEIDG